MKRLRLLIYLAALIVIVLSGCSEGSGSYDHKVALRRVLAVQQLQNLSPGDSTAVPKIIAIVDSMRQSGKDACYFGAINVLIDRLFADGRYAEADSLAVRMQQEAYEEADSLAIAMAKRVRAQILYKLNQSDRAQQEALSALPYLTNPIKSGPYFGTATSLDEWLHIIARANSDTAVMRMAGSRYSEKVKRNFSENSWSDPSGHYPVTALAFEAENAYLDGNCNQAMNLLDSATTIINNNLPARVYEHFYDIRSRVRAHNGDFSGAFDDVDTLITTHRCFPWFYLRDLILKAEVQNMSGQHEESARTYSQYISYHDSLSANLTDLRLRDLTLLYHSELDREEKRTNTIRLIALGSVSLLLMILLGVTYRNALMERKRNRMLVERLHEYDRANQTLIEKIPKSSPENEEESLIFRLDRHMISDQPYTDPALGRTELADYLGISQDTLAQLIRSKHGQSVHAYINSYRTEEARRIIDSEPSVTVADLATRLGFGTSRTLQRAFKERFDMTPTQYREASAALRSPENQ